jgi:hypothetical protein
MFTSITLYACDRQNCEGAVSFDRADGVQPYGQLGCCPSPASSPRIQQFTTSAVSQFKLRSAGANICPNVLSRRAKFLFNATNFLPGESALSLIVTASDMSTQPGYEAEIVNFLRPALQDSEAIEAIGTFLPQLPGWVYVVCTANDPADGGEDEDDPILMLEPLIEGIPTLIRSDGTDIQEELSAQGTLLPADCAGVLFVGEGGVCVRRVYGDEFDQCLQLLAYPHMPLCDLSHYPVGDFVSISKPGQYFGDVGCIAAHSQERNMDCVLLLLPPQFLDPADVHVERLYNVLTLWPPVATPSIDFLQALQQSTERKCVGSYDFLWYDGQWYTKDGLVG